MRMPETGYPPRQGLYDPALEHDSCGFGFVADIKGRPSHEIVTKALEVLLNLEHRGATGAEKDTGDGAGILLQTPHAFLSKECGKLGLTLPALKSELHRLRHRFKTLVRQEVASTVSAPHEIDEEMSYLQRVLIDKGNDLNFSQKPPPAVS